ncbi:MAG TPA: hypothetical protein VMB51_15810 [Solirubrobacteraceae bacterium]|nr:hypothetical protein [Solirubrobacteraceae bacterium]
MTAAVSALAASIFVSARDAIVQAASTSTTTASQAIGIRISSI